MSIGKIEAYAQDVRTDYRRLDEMLRASKERADIGEMMLEKSLQINYPKICLVSRRNSRMEKSQTPTSYLHQELSVSTRNFCLIITEGIARHKTYPKKENTKKLFTRNIKDHLQKIADDCITPNDGTVDFAFAYIQSESVYYFMITETYDLLGEYARRDVQVLSSLTLTLTLTHKITIIRAGIHAKRLSEQAIVQLKKAFEEYDKRWKTFMYHFTNAQKQAVGDLDKAYKKLQNEFEQIESE